MHEQPVWRKLVSPGGFFLVLLCFALPFVTVSCEYPSGVVTLDYTGGDVLLGGEPNTTGMPPDLPRLDGPPADAQLFAFLAFFTCFLGLCAGFAWVWRGRVLASLLSAGLAAMFLVVNQVTVVRRIKDEIESSGRFPRGAGDQMVQTRAGFWLALGFLLLVIGYNVVEAVRQQSRTSVIREPGNVPSPGTWRMRPR